MARVSQEHLDARRRQILDGAARCFARNGFHATSMQDVLKEVDLSAGAVYRYFSGKEELIGAIVAEVLGSIREAFEEAARQHSASAARTCWWAGSCAGARTGGRGEVA